MSANERSSGPQTAFHSVETIAPFITIEIPLVSPPHDHASLEKGHKGDDIVLIWDRSCERRGNWWQKLFEQKGSTLVAEIGKGKTSLQGYG